MPKVEFPELEYPCVFKRLRVFSGYTFISWFIPLLMAVTITILIVLSFVWVNTNAPAGKIVSLIISLVPSALTAIGAIGVVTAWLVSTTQKRTNRSILETAPFWNGVEFKKGKETFSTVEIKMEAPEKPWFNVLTYAKVEFEKDRKYFYLDYYPMLKGTHEIILHPEKLFIDELQMGYLEWTNTKDVQIGFIFSNPEGYIYHIKAGATKPKRIWIRQPLKFFGLKGIDFMQPSHKISYVVTEEIK